MRFLRLLLLVCILFQLSCNEGSRSKNVVVSSKSSSRNKLIVHLQPFGDMPLTEVNKLKLSLSAHFDSVMLQKHEDFPSSTYVKARNRYRADGLLKHLKSKGLNEVYQLGVSEMDISTTKEPHQDWGVMGLSYCPGKQSVISAFRLDKKRKTEQLYKVAVHELGHAYGLPHCKEKTCYMRDANGKNPLNEEVEFCNKCRSFLLAKGWKL